MSEERDTRIAYKNELMQRVTVQVNMEDNSYNHLDGKESIHCIYRHHKSTNQIKPAEEFVEDYWIFVGNALRSLVKV